MNDKKVSIAMIQYGLRVATEQYDLGKDFGDKLFSFFLAGDNRLIATHILKEWGCIEGDRVVLTKLSNPVLIRPCARLATLYNNNGMPEPHRIFKQVEEDPNLFNRMVYTYRMCYDILYAHNLPFMEEGEADKFTDGAILWQFDGVLSGRIAL